MVGFFIKQRSFQILCAKEDWSIPFKGTSKRLPVDIQFQSIKVINVFITLLSIHKSFEKKPLYFTLNFKIFPHLFGVKIDISFRDKHFKILCLVTSTIFTKTTIISRLPQNSVIFHLKEAVLKYEIQHVNQNFFSRGFFHFSSRK